MRLALPAMGHRRWELAATAFVDGELDGAGRSRFEVHLVACQRCSQSVVEARRTRDALRSLPAMRAPRSFVLTPEMAAAARPTVSTGRVWPTRLAYGLGALALAALFAVGAADLTTSGSRSSTSNTAASAPFQQRSVGEAPAADSAAHESVPTPQTKGIAAPPAGGVGAQSVPSPEPTKTADSRDLAPNLPGSAGGSAAGSPNGQFSSPSGPPTVNSPSIPRPAPSADDGNRATFRIAEAGLLALCLGAGATAIVLSRRYRRS